MPPWPHAAPRQTSIHQAHLATNHCLFPTRCRLLLLALPSALACAVIDMCVDALPPARHVLETNVYGCLSGHVAPIHMFLDALPRGPTEARHPPLPHNSPWIRAHACSLLLQWMAAPPTHWVRNPAAGRLGRKSGGSACPSCVSDHAGHCLGRFWPCRTLPGAFLTMQDIAWGEAPSPGTERGGQAQQHRRICHESKHAAHLCPPSPSKFALGPGSSAASIRQSPRLLHAIKLQCPGLLLAALLESELVAGVWLALAVGAWHKCASRAAEPHKAWTSRVVADSAWAGNGRAWTSTECPIAQQEADLRRSKGMAWHGPRPKAGKLPKLNSFRASPSPSATAAVPGGHSSLGLKHAQSTHTP